MFHLQVLLYNKLNVHLLSSKVNEYQGIQKTLEQDLLTQ